LHEYKTRAGRSVYDGSGVCPDIAIKQERFADITQTLVGKYLIFDYASAYRSTHPKINPAKNFNLSDEDYADFVKYLSGKNYSYSTASEKILTALKTEASKDKQFSELQPELEALRNKLSSTKKNDLQVHKPEIKQVLENEIASRYYFEKGRYEANFKYDNELAQAVKIMQDKIQIAAILKGEGVYKVIGKPQPTLAAAKPADDSDKH
jgi:carboxyl-terminal processing protease